MPAVVRRRWRLLLGVALVVVTVVEVATHAEEFGRLGSGIWNLFAALIRLGIALISHL